MFAALTEAPTAAAFNGVQAKAWAGRLAALGPRPAGGENGRRAGAIVRQRFLEERARLVGEPGACRQHSEVVPGLDKLRIDRQRAAEVVGGLVEHGPKHR